MLPRSIAIPKNLKTFDLGSAFSALVYPALGFILLLVALALGIFLTGLELKWYYLPLGIGLVLLSIFVCNMGIGPLHRIMQHRAGVLTVPGQILTMINLIFAMQGSVRDWVNYHSQHHRFADKPGDPHNPAESRRWAWIGWILFRDINDLKRPMPIWLKEHPVVVWMDRFYNSISVGIHLGVPAVVYLVVWLTGGSLLLTAILHACVVIGRAIQFHATVYGINVLGHLKTPVWLDHFVGLLTGGEAFHDHHHDEPQSALHRPRKGIWNRIVDYNGTVLLFMEKIGMVCNLKIASNFA